MQKYGDTAATPRNEIKAVEINSLWYNRLPMIVASI